MIKTITEKIIDMDYNLNNPGFPKGNNTTNRIEKVFSDIIQEKCLSGRIEYAFYREIFIPGKDYISIRRKNVINSAKYNLLHQRKGRKIKSYRWSERRLHGRDII